jgi:sec-independent protein translocase protein TatA
MPNIGPMEIVVVLILALIVLGPKRLPDVGRSLGRSMREFRESVSGLNDRQELSRVPEPAPVEADRQSSTRDTEVHRGSLT